jgi:hypothetical protein
MPAESLKTLMNQAHAGKLVLPDFQRDFVWKPRDTIRLLTSIFNEYPIGGLLLMENSGVYSFRALSGVPYSAGPQECDPDDADSILVLDGQQRLTSCYRAFFGSLDAKITHAGAYYFDYDLLVSNSNNIQDIAGPEIEEYLVFEKPRKVTKDLNETSREIAAGLFPLDIIFQKPRGASYSDWLSEYSFSRSCGREDDFKSLSSIQAGFISGFIERVTGYQVHYEKITRDTKPDVICVVFETINTTGKRLTVFDLLVARCFRFDIKLRDMLEEAIESSVFIKKFDATGEKLCVNVIPKIIALMSTGASKRKDIVTLDPRDIEREWSKAVQSLERALELLETRFGCYGERFIPFLDCIPVLACILASEKFHDTDEQMRMITRWYWRTVFSGYFAGSSETKVIRSYKEILGDGGWFENPDKQPEAVRDFGFRESILDDVFRVDSGIYRGILSLLLSSGLTDFGSRQERLSEIAWEAIDDHHIYPSKLLRSHGIKGGHANTILNRTPIHSITNQRIGDKAPDVYFHDKSIVGPNGISDAVLEQHAIPKQRIREQFSRGNYETFLEERKMEILIRIEEITASRTQPDE